MLNQLSVLKHQLRLDLLDQLLVNQFGSYKVHLSQSNISLLISEVDLRDRYGEKLAETRILSLHFQQQHYQ